MTRAFIKAVREQFERELGIIHGFSEVQRILAQFDNAVLDAAYRFSADPKAMEGQYREAPVNRS
jgi:hypothetical protein